jgi:hypothetical protein
MTPATARSHTRRSPSPTLPRRVSGPVRRPVAVPGGAVAVPRRGTTTIFARVRALPEHRMVDRLLRSRLWIWALGVMLGGIVTMQVSLLKLNSGISRAVEASATLERQNANMQDRIARLSSSQRISDAAAKEDMVYPPAGEVGYLRARGALDDQRAARRMTPPSEEAQAVMAAGGHDATAVPPATTTPQG